MAADTPEQKESRLLRLLEKANSPIILAIVGAFIFGIFLIRASGVDPFFALGEMATGSVQGSGLSNSLNRSIPLVGMGLAIAISFRAGILNLGAEGQMLFGGIAGTAVALHMPGPGIIVILTSIVAGAAAGSMWGFLSGIAQTHGRVPILITSLLMNYVARAIVGYLVNFPLAEPGSAVATTPALDPKTFIPKIPGTRISVMVIAIVVVCIIFAWFLSRSVFGYETKMSGLSNAFAQYGGVNTVRRTLEVMIATGALSGAIGAYLILGDSHRFVDGEFVSAGYAWTGLMIALLAMNRPMFILLAGTFFAFLEIGGLAMQRNSNVSWHIAQVIEASVIIFLVFGIKFPSIQKRLQSKRSRSSQLEIRES